MSLVHGAIRESTAAASAAAVTLIVIEHTVIVAVVVAIYTLWRYQSLAARLRQRAALHRPAVPARVVLGYTLVVCVFAYIAIYTTDPRYFALLSIVGVAIVVLALLHTAAAVRIACQYQTAERVRRFAVAVAPNLPPECEELTPPSAGPRY